MSGLLQGLIVVVGLAAAVFTGGSTLGIVAAALSATAFAAQQGWLGKGAQNFANSAVGHDLTLAVGLASAAVALGGYVNAVQAGSQSATTAAANAAAEGPAGGAAAASGVAQAGGAASDAAPVAGVTSTSNEVIASASGPGGMAMQFQNANPGIMDPSLSEQSVDAVNDLQNSAAIASGTNGPGGPPVNPDEAKNLQQTVAPQQSVDNAQSAATTADQSAVNPQASGGLPPGDPGETGVTNTGGAGAPATAAQGAPPGMLSKAADAVGGALKTPQGMLMAGQAISGWAQGKAQENINQRNLAAQQWGNVQWTQPNQVAQLDAQAATPLTVPQGYLARAAAVRNLMNGSTNQTTPLQSSNGAPPTVAPTQAQPLAAPGAGLATGQASNGPVPVYAMNATPRGGVI
jgi:hypothetical protein